MEIKNRLSLILQNFESKVESILNKENLSIKEEFLDINKLREILSKNIPKQIQKMSLKVK